MSDPHEDLAAQHTLARQEFPDAETHEIAELIVSRLGREQCLALAADMLGYWPSEPPGNLREMASHEVLNYVMEMESDATDD